MAGIHGAGLINVIYCALGCCVLEKLQLPEKGYSPGRYILLAGMFGNSYRAIIEEVEYAAFSDGFFCESYCVKNRV